MTINWSQFPLPRCLDFFAGCGQWSKSHRKQGFSTVVHEIFKGCTHDVCDPSYCEWLRSILCQFHAFHLVMECTTWSMVSGCFWGSPGFVTGKPSMLADVDYVCVITNATKMAENACSLFLYAAIELNIITTLNNPKISLLWRSVFFAGKSPTLD